MLEPLDHAAMLVFGDEDKDFTTEESEDFDPDAESSLSITFAFSRKGGGLSTHTVYLDEEKLKNKRAGNTEDASSQDEDQADSKA